MIIKPSLNMTFNPEAFGERNASYSYALNAPSLGMANIGAANEVPEPWLTKETVSNVGLITQLGVEDYLTPEKERDFNPSREHIIAVFARVSSYTDKDFDCLHMRLDGDKNWSYKPKSAPAKKIIICNIKKPTKELYEVSKRNQINSWFIGYFKLPENGIPALGRLEKPTQTSLHHPTNQQKHH